MKRRHVAALFASLPLACATLPQPASSHVNVLQEQPLAGDEVQLVPAVSEEVLGWVLDAQLSQLLDDEGVPQDSDAAWLSQLLQQARPNPCAEHLRVLRAAHSREATALLPLSLVPQWLQNAGLAGYAQLTSHVLFRVKYTEKQWLEELPEYAACCAARGCGVARIDALRRGEQRIDAALAWQHIAPPLVFLARDGQQLGIGLHDGRELSGVVSVSVRSTAR